jgi:NAD-dependent deacetylase
VARECALTSFGLVNAFAGCDDALIIGTSGVVEPAASLARLAKQQGAFVIEINPAETPLSLIANLSLRTSASEGMTILLEDQPSSTS